MSASVFALSSPPSQDSLFFDHAFTAVLSVMERTRDTIMAGSFAGLDSKQKMRMSREISRLTSRSASAMSLLLLYRALVDDQAQEIDNIPARLEDLYQGVLTPDIDDGLGELALPPAAISLMDEAETAFGYMERVHSMIISLIAN